MNGSHLVKEARKRAGITQAELAERAGTTQSAIARIESGRTAPSLERLSELTRQAGFDIELALLPYDDHDVSIAKQNLDLTMEARLEQLVRTTEWIQLGRTAVAQADRERD
jgi:transcriptional regulator with XRE-family HTH domain